MKTIEEEWEEILAEYPPLMTVKQVVAASKGLITEPMI